MSLFDTLTHANQPTRPTLQQLQANPSQFLKQAGYTVPDGMTNPQQIVSHLLQSGQISNPKLQMIRQFLGR